MARCDSYAAGNCTWGACSENGWIPEGLGDGGDWAQNAAARGFDVTGEPTVGSVVSYCRGDGYSQWGHCASVVDVGQGGSFEVHEMNYVGFGEWDYRWSGMGDVCGFILAPGMQPGGGGGGRGGGIPGLPGQLHQAWQDVRNYSHDVAADLAARYVNSAGLVWAATQ